MKGQKVIDADSSRMKWYLLEPTERERLISIKSKLFREERMDGDEMRDMAQAIDYIINNMVEAGEGDTL